MPDQLKGVLFASVTAFLWGFLAIALKVATQQFPVVTIVWFRFAFAFLVLFIYFSLTDKTKLKILIRPPLLLVIAGIGLAANYIGYAKGIEYTSPTTAQVVIQLGPIMLGLVGFLIFREKIGKKQMIGFAVALIGLTFFYLNQVTGLIESKLSLINTGFAWIVAAAFAWAIYASLQKILVKTIETQVLNLFIFGLPTLVYAPFVDFSQLFHINVNQWLLLIFLGLNTLVAYGSLAFAFKYADVNKVSVIITLNPIITFIAMSILYQMQVSWIETQRMDFLTWAGAIMVIAGAVMVVYFKKR